MLVVGKFPFRMGLTDNTPGKSGWMGTEGIQTVPLSRGTEATQCQFFVPVEPELMQ